MGEPRARRVQPDQARRFGRGEGAGGQPGYRRGGQFRAVGGRGEQQRGPRCRGQGGVLGGHDGGQLTGQRERLGGPAAPGVRVGGDHLRQLDQRQRVPGRLGEHLLAGPAARRARLRVKEPPGVRQAQRRQQQLREVPLEARRRHVPARAEQQHELLRFQAAGGEGERVERGTVQPLRVVSDHQQRAVVRQPGQQGEHGDPGQQRVGRHGILGDRESAAQRLGLPGRQAGHAVQHRAQQLVQPGERQVLLRLPAGRRQHPHPRRPGLPRRLGQQDGLAQARIAQEQQHPAFRMRRGHQFPQPGQFLPPPDQARVLAGHRADATLIPANIGKAIAPRESRCSQRAVKLRIPDGRPARHKVTVWMMLTAHGGMRVRDAVRHGRPGEHR